MRSSPRLVERRPGRTAPDLLVGFVPPRRFRDVRFDTYVPSPEHPSQGIARDALQRFAAGVAAEPAGSGARKGRFSLGWRRSTVPARPRTSDAEGPPGRYLDGGFGVGKTHLLASLWHEAGPPKAYVSFEELTAYIGFVGLDSAVQSFASHRLLCIDEFELDDVANTRMMVTFLGAVIQRGARLAATSNAIPGRLGEGRFNAEDFAREIGAIAAHWDVLRIDGPDYRVTHGGIDVGLDPGRAVPSAEAAQALAAQPRVSVDRFDDVLAHLRTVHPVQYGGLLDGLDGVVLHDLHRLDNQGQALLFVQLIDEIYDRELAFGATGCAVGELFPSEYRHGGYRKKYGRCESRLIALLDESSSSVQSH